MRASAILRSSACLSLRDRGNSSVQLDSVECAQISECLPPLDGSHVVFGQRSQSELRGGEESVAGLQASQRILPDSFSSRGNAAHARWQRIIPWHVHHYTAEVLRSSSSLKSRLSKLRAVSGGAASGNPLRGRFLPSAVRVSLNCPGRFVSPMKGNRLRRPMGPSVHHVSRGHE